MMLIILLILLIDINYVNGYYNNKLRNVNRNKFLNDGVWPPSKKSPSSTSSSSSSSSSSSIKENNINNDDNNNNENEQVFIATLSGTIASFLISQDFTAILIGTLLANSLAERRDAIGSTTRTFGLKVNELKSNLDILFSSQKKIIKTPYRFESNKAGLSDPNFWSEAHSAVSYTLGNDIEAREKHLMMMKKIIEEEEKIIMKQKIEKEVTDATKVNIDTSEIKNENKKVSWKQNFAFVNDIGSSINNFFQNSFTNFNYEESLSSSSSLTTTAATATTTTSLSSENIESIKKVVEPEPAIINNAEDFFPLQEKSSFSYKPKKGRMQLAALSSNQYDDNNYNVISDKKSNDIISELEIPVEPVITEFSESETTSDESESGNSLYDFLFKLKNKQTEEKNDNDIILEESVVENSNSIINNSNIKIEEIVENTESNDIKDNTLISINSNVIEEIIEKEVDRFNQAEDLERFRKWGQGIEWDKVKVQGSNLYYHIQKDILFPNKELPINRNYNSNINNINNNNIVTKSIGDRETWVKDIISKATKTSATYNYYKEKLQN